MLEVLISILFTLNIQFSQLDERSVQLSSESLIELQSSSEFIEKSRNGTIHDLTYQFDELTHDEIIILPDIDPVN